MFTIGSNLSAHGDAIKQILESLSDSLSVRYYYIPVADYYSGSLANNCNTVE